MSTTIHLHVEVDLDELRKWANWHCDHGHQGVAAVLFDAIKRFEAEATIDGICTAEPCILTPGHKGKCRR